MRLPLWPCRPCWCRSITFCRRFTIRLRSAWWPSPLRPFLRSDAFGRRSSIRSWARCPIGRAADLGGDGSGWWRARRSRWCRRGFCCCRPQAQPLRICWSGLCCSMPGGPWSMCHTRRGAVSCLPTTPSERVLQAFAKAGRSSAICAPVPSAFSTGSGSRAWPSQAMRRSSSRWAFSLRSRCRSPSFGASLGCRSPKRTQSARRAGVSCSASSRATPRFGGSPERICSIDSPWACTSVCSRC